MSITDTSIEFKSSIKKKKLIIYSCEQCPRFVFHRDFGVYCGGINLPYKEERKIQDIRKIPEWCQLENEK